MVEMDLLLQLEDMHLEMECLFPRRLALQLTIFFGYIVTYYLIKPPQKRWLLSKEIPQILQHNPGKDCTQVSWLLEEDCSWIVSILETFPGL